MRRIALFLASIVTLLPLSAAAEWRALSGEDLRAALSGRKLLYDNGAWQTFASGGRTLYNSGQDSWGQWSVRDDQYCSTWPPSDLWTCYDLEIDGRELRFIGPSGDISKGRYAE